MKINFYRTLAVLCLIFSVTSSILNAQNTITIKVYDDDLTTQTTIDGTLSNFNETFYVIAYDQNNIVLADAVPVVNGMAVVNNIPNGTQNFMLSRQTPDAGANNSGNFAINMNDGATIETGIAVGTPTTIDLYTNAPNINNVAISSDETISFGFTNQSYGTVSGYIKDDNDVGIGGVTVNLKRNSDGSVAKSIITLNTVNDFNEYGKFEFKDVIPGEYAIEIVAPTGFDIINNIQSSDGDTYPENTTDELIPVTLTDGENDTENYFILKVPTNAEDCTLETTDVRFDWSTSAGSGNEWTKSDNADGSTKTYTLNYTDGLGNAQTVDITVKMIDPTGMNLDDNFSCPFTSCDNSNNIFTETNGIFGSGFLTLAQASTNTSDEVTFEFTMSKPVYVKNFSVSDIDYVSLTEYGPKVSFQDEITMTAANGSTPVDLNYTVGSNLQTYNSNTFRTEYITTGNGANGDSSPSYPSNTVLVNSTEQVTKLVVKYRNGQDEAAVAGDNGKSDGHFVRLNGFNLCIVNYAAIHGQLTEDTTGDNTGDTGKSGVTIILKNSDGSLATFADGSTIPPIVTSDGTTDVDGDGTVDPAGSYYIPNVNAGTYTVEIVTPSGYNNIDDGDASPDDGGASTPPNSSTTDGLVPVTVETGQREMNNDFVIQNISLPVQLISFDATKRNKDVLLTWSTAAEENNDYYTLEYGFDGINFQKINNQKGNGTTLKRNEYSYVHRNIGLTKKDIFYRLTQFDIDGNKTYLGNIRKVTFNDASNTIIYPNPVAKGQKLYIRDISEVSHYKLYNNLGKLISSGNFEVNQEIDIKNLNTGIYFIHFDNGEMIRFTIQ